VFLARVFRDLALDLRKLAVGATDEHSKLRKRLVTAILATLVIDAIGSVLMYVLEHEKHGSNITSPFQAFFWVTTQLLTVSSQMPNPLTTGGRVVDIFLELWAITVVTTVAGSFAAFLANKD
jgi:ion channel